MGSVDMSWEAVRGRLQAASDLGAALPDRMAGKVDYSPAGVTRRLEERSQLSALCTEPAELGRGLNQSK